MDVEWPLRCISKSPQETVVERSSSSFQEFFQRRFVNQSFGALGTVVCQQIGTPTPQYPMQAERKMDKAKGTARNVAGDVKDAARDAMDNSSRPVPYQKQATGLLLF
jgi:uncharacterized protein YjbJ (UPF0337 family)